MLRRATTSNSSSSVRIPDFSHLLFCSPGIGLRLRRSKYFHHICSVSLYRAEFEFLLNLLSLNCSYKKHLILLTLTQFSDKKNYKSSKSISSALSLALLPIHIFNLKFFKIGKWRGEYFLSTHTTTLTASMHYYLPVGTLCLY